MKSMSVVCISNPLILLRSECLERKCIERTLNMWMMDSPKIHLEKIYRTFYNRVRKIEREKYNMYVKEMGAEKGSNTELPHQTNTASHDAQSFGVCSIGANPPTPKPPPPPPGSRRKIRHNRYLKASARRMAYIKSAKTIAVKKNKG